MYNFSMKFILGIDEVGRGPWAGPLVIGAVILPRSEEGELPDWTADLTDSKKLSKKKREDFSDLILKNALATGLGWVSSRELDELGLSPALSLATKRALREIRYKKVPFSEIIIDGTINFLKNTPLESRVTLLKKADFLIKEVSAASIIAKVARDRYMEALAETYPNYHFEKHVGYGTAVHRAAIEKYGPCPEHRLSFKPLEKYRKETGSRQNAPEKAETINPTSKAVGDFAEGVVAEFLESNRHEIIARNYRTKFYEIDIISVEDDKIYFTEVKYRREPSRGEPLDAITQKKLKQMTFGAEAFLASSPTLKTNFSPLLAAASVSGPEFMLDDWFVIE